MEPGQGPEFYSTDAQYAKQNSERESEPRNTNKECTDTNIARNYQPNIDKIQNRIRTKQNSDTSIPTKRQQISVIFNESSLVLTKAMENLLNRGLNFSILPKKLDLTQVLVDFRRFERSLIWHEFWYGKETEPYEKPIFKTQKRNMPKNYKSPKGLEIFINSMKSEIMDPKNRNQSECNLPQEEIQALKDLIKLQRDRKIVI